MIAGREEILAWLSHPVTVAVRAEVVTLLEGLRLGLPDHVIKGDQDRARATAGAIRAYEQFLTQFLSAPEGPAEEAPDAYRDPAERPSKET